MKKEILNGVPIPYNRSVEALREMADSPDMKDFSLACEALSSKNQPDAYEVLKSHIHDGDKYRRLYVLKTIFRCPEAAELTEYLEGAIASEDFLFAEQGLRVAATHRVRVSEALLKDTVWKCRGGLGYTALGSLRILEASDENFDFLVKLFGHCAECGQKEILAEILCDGYLPAGSMELFDLFAGDDFAKIRLLGVRLGKRYGLDLARFASDPDGHVRKAVCKP